MRFILGYMKPYRARIALGLLIKSVGTLVELILPYILSHILDVVVPNDGRVYMIVLWGLGMVACALVALFGNVIANRMATKVARDSSESIRHDLFSRIMHLSGRQIDEFTIPSLESRITSDTYHVHHFIGMIQRLGVRAPLLLVGGVIVTLIMDPFLSLIMLAMLPVIFIAVFFVSRKGVPMFTRVQSASDGMIRVVREDSQGIRVIKALSKTEYENQRYDKVNRNLLRTEKKAHLTMGIINPAMNLLMNFGITFVVLVGAYRVMGGQSEAGRIIAFTQYFTMISQALMSITRMFTMYTRCSASARRIQEVVSAPYDLEVADSSQYPSVDDGSFIRFDSVNFSYNGVKNNLSDVSFSLKKGQTLGIIGATGSGKTTLINLLMRFYDVSSGNIYIDGRDVRTIEKSELRNKFGVAMQNDFLYADTIEENIRFGRDNVSREAVERAAAIAQADGFIRAFPDGYGHELAQKGTNVSGGQKQRLLISRAIAGDPEILILDDSSSALDYKTDAELRRAIRESMPGTTSIIIAQRVSSVKNADLILVLEEGEIIGCGNHDSLMRDCEVYKEIENSQMGGAFIG